MYLLHQVSKGLRRRLTEALSELNLTNHQYTVLSMLRDREPLSSSDLSRRLYVTAQTMNELVSSLEKSGCVARSEDPSNRRILSVRLTEQGRRLIAKCEVIVDRIEGDAFSAISKSQLQDLRKTTKLLVDDLRHAMKPKQKEVGQHLKTVKPRRPAKASKARRALASSGS
jgi:DNA-binding MarR family transcriptional regulator